MTPTYAADFVEDRSRLTTFFRYVLVIPHLFVLMLWGIAAYFAVVCAWFAIVVTGRYPEGLYGFNASFLRYATAVSGYLSLLTDEYPPFSGDTDRYPVRLRPGPPKADYSRAKTFFRAILAIPVMVIAYVMSLVAGIGMFLSWFAIVVLGRQPQGLQDMINLGVGYQSRANAYIFLLSEDFPPFQSPPESATPPPVQGFSTPQTAF